jgi:hypothetical protein
MLRIRPLLDDRVNGGLGPAVIPTINC